MATNFDYLLEKELFGEFAEQAVEAEKAIAISPEIGRASGRERV